MKCLSFLPWKPGVPGLPAMKALAGRGLQKAGNVCSGSGALTELREPQGPPTPETQT